MAKSTFLAALGGGVVGAALTGVFLFAAAPSLMGERLVRTGLVEHPQILIEASEALQVAQMAPVVQRNRAALHTAFGSSFAGASSAEADVVMVEFYDYACGFCRQAKPEVEKLLAEDPGLRVVYRELPVLGPDSVTAAKASLAASKAGKFDAFHEALYAAGKPTPDAIDAALAKVGVSRDALNDPAIEAELNQNFELANALGASGTPLFVIGETVIPSAAGYDAYKAAIDKARAG